MMMGQIGETPISSRQLYTPAPAKRPREESDASSEGAPSPKRRVKSMMDVFYRIVLPSRQIGKVIGKEGFRIQRIRENTKATIKIADAISRHEERVIIISSKYSYNTISDAENALFQIADLILQDDDGNSVALKIGGGHVAANTIRLLITGCQVGVLIGVSGQSIEKLRMKSGASITVLAQNQLPLCASAYESDRVVQVSGDVSAVMKALMEIGSLLRDNPPKQTIAISPSYNLGFNRAPKAYLDPNSADYVTIEMLVLESMVGGLIGRCGSNISRIRTESGAAIKVHGGKGAQNHRKLQIGGSAQQVARAKQRIDEYVYSEYIQQYGIEASGVHHHHDPRVGLQSSTIQPSMIQQAIAQPIMNHGAGMGMMNAAASAYPPYYGAIRASQVPAFSGYSYPAHQM
ncbi:poly(rC)-binding protein 4-like [Impatiens glandulifera]|uniref:poly(rC)-binding protein 4-like n=1 Tax=Impatiens glandulifera TaxID=253017 RepID=UPI001FB0DA40|nr:poly(rC)-binding protein 4-like [Impatiens glandulifera]